VPQRDFASPTSEASTTARARRHALLGGLGIVVLLLFELGLRAGEVVSGGRALIGGGRFSDYPLVDHAGFVSLKGNYRGELWGHPFVTNRHGFRSPPIPFKRRAPNELRIVLLGTCITLGELDESSDGYSDVGRTLQSRLESGLPALQVSVMNAAVPGSFELRDLAYFRSVLAKFSPDIVILESGTAQIVDPAGMLREYRSRREGASEAAAAARGWGPREYLYDWFERSLVIRSFYTFRRSEKALFRKYFYRRAAESTAASGSGDENAGSQRVADYIAEIVDPSAEYYRRDLAELYSSLSRDVRVIAFTFPHSLPDAEFEALPADEQSHLAQVELMPGISGEMSAAEIWQIFRHSYRLIGEINESEARARGVGYIDLRANPELRRSRDYHPYYYYLPVSIGSIQKGRILADYILEHYSFSLD
jgi:hypothetical protein